MANDHFISRFLTTPWEVGQRRLHFYDFGVHAYGEASSESLFAKDGLHSEDTGKVLNRFIESPLSDYRARVLRASPGVLLFDTGDQRVFRGLVGLLGLQVQRHLDAKGVNVAMSLDQLLSAGEAVFDALVQITLQERVVLGITVPSNESLYFTEAAYFSIPMVGSAPILGVPLTPRHFVALAPRGYDEALLREWLETPSAVTAFSLGVGHDVYKVLIPPAVISARDDHPRDFEAGLHKMRDGARDLFDKVGEACAVAGLPVWRVQKASGGP